MATIHREFESVDWAEGFVDGLQYTNNPSIDYQDTIRLSSSRYIVVFTDDNKKVDELIEGVPV